MSTSPHTNRRIAGETAGWSCGCDPNGKSKAHQAERSRSGEFCGRGPGRLRKMCPGLRDRARGELRSD